MGVALWHAHDVAPRELEHRPSRQTASGLVYIDIWDGIVVPCGV